MAEQILVFDMDGVLVDVSESYRETIQQTVEHFTGRRVTREEIQAWKNRGGWNDDWALSTAMIHAEGVDTGYDDVVLYFQSIFHGDGTNGLILRERWIARQGLLERLGERFRLETILGRGSFGDVWRAAVIQDDDLPSLVALKIYHAEQQARVESKLFHEGRAVTETETQLSPSPVSVRQAGYSSAS